MKNTNKGIAPLIIALIIALLAGGGYAVVKTNPGLAQKLGIEKQVEKAKVITQFFEIKELDLRITVDDRLKDLVYNFQDFGGGAYAVRFSTDSITQISKYCAANDTPPFISLGVYTSDAWNKFVKENPGYYKNDTFKQVGKYKVIQSNPQSVCFEESDTIVVSLLQKQGEAFSEALKTLEPSTSGGSVSQKDWKTYTNEKYGFEMLYPVEWKTYIPQVKDMVVVLGVKAGKGNGDIDGDVFVSAYKKTEIYLNKKEDGSLKFPLDTLIDRAGIQFSDRKVIKEILTINGAQATKITVTTPSMPGWKEEQFFVERGDTIFIIDNGAVSKEMFEPVALSFKFTK